MKIILTENVKGLGKAGDLAEAKTGYAHNYLFRNKLAIPASEENLKKWEEEQKILKEEERKNREKANELKERIENITLKLKVKAGDNGKVFGSITTMDIANALKTQEKIDFDKKKIEIKDSLKNIGEFGVTVRVYPEITANLKIIIEKE